MYPHNGGDFKPTLRGIFNQGIGNNSFYESFPILCSLLNEYIGFVRIESSKIPVYYKKKGTLNRELEPVNMKPKKLHRWV